MNFKKSFKDGSPRPFGPFPKIHPFWRRHPSLTYNHIEIIDKLLPFPAIYQTQTWVSLDYKLFDTRLADAWLRSKQEQVGQVPHKTQWFFILRSKLIFDKATWILKVLLQLHCTSWWWFPKKTFSETERLFIKSKIICPRSLELFLVNLMRPALYVKLKSHCI